MIRYIMVIYDNISTSIRGMISNKNLQLLIFYVIPYKFNSSMIYIWLFKILI